jgi:hypothetical protein
VIGRIRTLAGRAYHYARRAIIAVAVVMAVLLVTVVTVDVGPLLKGQAERGGGAWLERHMTIGRLGVRLASGRFVLEDVQIDGMLPSDPPWLVARRIEVSLSWGALLRREILLDTVEMSDWQMVVETFPDGRQTFPRVTGPRRPPRTGPPLVVTTLQYVHAARGAFVFRDHGAPWSVVARNLDVVVGKLGEYRGQARFRGGTVKIQDFEPMWANMDTSFTIRGGKVQVDKFDLRTDGASTTGTGLVDLAHWPEQTYQIRSRVQFPRMRELFFARDSFSLFGEGDFRGAFHLYRGGRELKGDFTSALAGVNEYRFPNLAGSLVWLPNRFVVPRATAEFLGGQTACTYEMAPLGDRHRPARAFFDVEYTDVDLTAVSEFYQWRGLHVAGRASGRNQMAWPLGRFVERSGEGTMTVAPPAEVGVQGEELRADAVAAARTRAAVLGPFSPHTPLLPVPMSAELIYAFDRQAIRFQPSRVATPETFIAFEGTTAWGEQSRMPFRVTSHNWQESDRLLAGLMTTFGNATNAVPLDGVGRFDGVMLGAFRRPRIEGRFTGAEMRAWDVTWGDVEGEVVVENAYANISRAVVKSGPSRLDVSGQFSLGFPRADGGEEIDARVRVTNREVRDFREAFDLEDYDLDGSLSGDFHLYGSYTRPYGFGRMSLEGGMAYGEPFAEASASLRFEGAGVWLEGVEMHKGGGQVTGAAYVGWNGTYSFNADGRGLAVDTLALTSIPGYPPLTGQLDFTVGGSGSFDSPRYDFRANVYDLFIGDEGIGQATGRLTVRGTLLTYEFEAASPRLAVSGTGRVEINEQMDAELSFRAIDTSLDPYIRAFYPVLSPYTSAVASGTVRVVGELMNPEAVRIETSVDQADVRLLDYRLRNEGPIRLSVDRQVLRVDALKLVGEGTELDLTGTVTLPGQTLALQANGAANLAVLQGFLPNVRSSGRATVSARITGTAASPVVSGSAELAAGRLRQFAFPHAIENVTGRVSFDAGGIRLDGLGAQLGGGPVRFSGRIGMRGYRLSEYDVSATGENMRLRVPEGMRSVVDGTLTLQGPADAPVISGSVIVKSATYVRGLEASPNLFSGLTGSAPGVPAAPGQVVEPTSPVRLDVRVLAPSTLAIENTQARIVASADLTLRGTPERPLLFGRADIERGEVQFEGRRYLVTRGSLDFTDPDRILPFFDVEAETRVRVPGQTYRVTLRVAGTTERLQPEFTADPPLPVIDILTLLFSDQPPSGDVELARLRRPDEQEQRLVEARAARALTGALSAEVGRVVEQTFGVDTFQITPLLSDPYQQSARVGTLNPTARVTIGKRISDRVFLTYARSLSSSTRDEIVLLEFDVSETFGWVLSQNEDRSYALEVRKRYTF